jgi:hypothetical protein
MGARTVCLLLLILLAASCRETSRPMAVVGPSDGSASALPEIGGLAAGPEESRSTYRRRSYARKDETITVTLAHFPMTAAEYDGWLRMSAADFPQAALGFDTSEGNGFYECAADDPSRCNLLVQLRCGQHIEIRGQGVALRKNVDAIAHGLGLSKMARDCRAGAAE